MSRPSDNPVAERRPEHPFLVPLQRQPLQGEKRSGPFVIGLSKVLSLLALGCAGALVVLDLTQDFINSWPHRLLSAVPLAAVAIAYLAQRATNRPTMREALKAILLSGAFALWAASQTLAVSYAATILNDLAVALFVIDMALVIADRGAQSDIP